jgi:hypothetical protein
VPLVKWVVWTAVVVVVAFWAVVIAIGSGVIGGDATPSDAEQATNIANVVCAGETNPPCPGVKNLHHLAGGYWKFSMGHGICAVVNLRKFSFRPRRGIRPAPC